MKNKHGRLQHISFRKNEKNIDFSKLSLQKIKLQIEALLLLILLYCVYPIAVLCFV